MISYGIGKAVMQEEKEISLSITNLLLLMLLVQPLFFVNDLAMTAEIKDAINYALGTGNSARFVRGFILPIVIVLINIGSNIKWEYCKFPGKLFGYIGTIGIGILAGFSFCWSNDYGISSWLCLIILLVVVQFSRNKKIFCAVKHGMAGIIISLISLFFFVELFTQGHFGGWLQSTFGTGGYQGWYYNSSKSYYLYEVDFSFIMLLQAMIGVVYLWLLFKEKGNLSAVKRYGVLAFVNITSFCAVNEYKLLSGGGSREVALVVLFFTIIFEALRLVLKVNKSKTKLGLTILSVTVGIAWIGSTLKDELIFFYATDKNGQYNEALGGYVTARSGDMELASDFLNGEKFWATYASGQEVVEGQFQPSGTDYIIHVLGDRQRDEYMDKFHKGGFRYVSTIQKNFTDWEYWVERANWFFYRELYQEWHPVFANQYQVYWEKTQEYEEKDYTVTDGISLEIIPEDGANIRLIVRTDKPIDGVADVFIDYEVKKAAGNFASMFMFQSVLMNRNTGLISASNDSYESNYLRNKSSEYIPIPVSDGYGETLLTSLPEKSTFLELKDAECKAIYTSMFDNMQTMNLTDDNWTNGIHKSGNVLLLQYKEAIFNRIEKADSIGTSEQLFSIERIEHDAEYIRVYVNGDANVCQYPSLLTLGGSAYE